MELPERPGERLRIEIRPQDKVPGVYIYQGPLLVALVPYAMGAYLREENTKNLVWMPGDEHAAGDAPQRRF